ncbi:MAG TPA: hypothetical protein VMU95_40570 [Trebonia sp.]|nr:hypothetical protein [Trebonia sp.]
MSAVEESWRDVAVSTREALRLMGYQRTGRCFPGEPFHDLCGRGWPEHAMAMLATVKAVAEHQLQHLAPPASRLDLVYKGVARELVEGCCCEPGGQR